MSDKNKRRSRGGGREARENLEVLKPKIQLINLILKEISLFMI